MNLRLTLPLIVAFGVVGLAGCSSSEDDEVVSDMVDCTNPVSTVEINRCMSNDLRHAEAVLMEYVDKAREALGTDSMTLEAFDKSQSAWASYREAHCDAVYTFYRDGTIRGSMNLGCKTVLTEERTYAVWETFLTRLDGSEPLMPEPVFRLPGDSSGS